MIYIPLLSFAAFAAFLLTGPAFASVCSLRFVVCSLQFGAAGNLHNKAWLMGRYLLGAHLLDAFVTEQTHISLDARALCIHHFRIMCTDIEQTHLQHLLERRAVAVPTRLDRRPNNRRQMRLLGMGQCSKTSLRSAVE